MHGWRKSKKSDGPASVKEVVIKILAINTNLAKKLRVYMNRAETSVKM
jgi:hypothetical protein